MEHPPRGRSRQGAGGRRAGRLTRDPEVSWKASPALCKEGRTINLTDYGFSDRASSWANNSDYLVDVWEHEDNRGGRRLWTELPGTYNAQALHGHDSTSLNCYA
ncbi:hypothetical protein PV726_26205 [Streptomyces europaeiscabiei]|uniref:hypothetical protein n=1 Tax=Streptomyces europaeiscabiei TaxID=146819 RepID=UPI0029A7E17B|nr:hypothetical protein [Streptomyces europaeiscabiei]MDX3693769.1 hypothetical protein [Streptomyces europaeiscabiei]